MMMVSAAVMTQAAASGSLGMRTFQAKAAPKTALMSAAMMAASAQS
jgi:hypothetical protein